VFASKYTTILPDKQKLIEEVEHIIKNNTSNGKNTA
jgi:hypothetical protein